MREVRLYGFLGKKYGKSMMLEIGSPAEAIRALRANFPEFERDVANHKQGFYVFVGKRNIGKEDLVAQSGDNTIKIVPIITGSKNGGALQTILGAVLIAVGVYFDYSGTLISLGVSLMAGGVSQMLTKTPRVGLTPSEDTSARTPSYAFNGPVNTAAQGHVVPVVYGRMLVGSHVISAGLSAEEIAV